MGHQHLGTLPRSRKWQQVIKLLNGGADVHEIAAATSIAAEQQMSDASDDAAVKHAVWLLTQIPVAARAKSQVQNPSSQVLALVGESGPLHPLHEVGRHSNILWLVLWSSQASGPRFFGRGMIFLGSPSKAVANARLNCSFPRESRDITVPIGTPKAAEISL